MSSLIAMLSTAFLSGMLASGHCLTMCGGIALCSPKPLQSHLIRISLYSILAAILSLSVSIWHIEVTGLPGISRAWLGIGLISAALFSLISYWRSRDHHCHQCPRLASSSSKSTAMLRPIDWLWGALPCPMVIAMLAASLATDHILSAMAFMLCFGLGTLPALVGLQFGKKALMMRIPIKSSQPILASLLLIGGLWTLTAEYNMSHSHGSHSSHSSQHIHEFHDSHHFNASHDKPNGTL